MSAVCNAEKTGHVIHGDCAQAQAARNCWPWPASPPPLIKWKSPLLVEKICWQNKGQTVRPTMTNWRRWSNEPGIISRQVLYLFCILFLSMEEQQKKYGGRFKIRGRGNGCYSQVVYIYLYTMLWTREELKKITELLYVICISNTIHLYLLLSI